MSELANTPKHERLRDDYFARNAREISMFTPCHFDKHDLPNLTSSQNCFVSQSL